MTDWMPGEHRTGAVREEGKAVCPSIACQRRFGVSQG